MGTWIDFRALRQSIDFAQVLAHYRIQLKVKGDQAYGFCPLPTHHGQQRSPSFSVNLKKNIFRCFGGCCGAQGNIIDFCALMEGLNPQDKGQFRQAALLLQERFSGPIRAGAKPAQRSKPKKPAPEMPTQPPSDDSQVIVNAPLDFELKNLDPHHPYLRDRGFTIETAVHFGLGYCSRGLLKGRIAIPLHDHAGKLIGYAGRLVDTELMSDQNPKYLFPSRRQHNGVTHEFKKSFFLYNGFAAGRNLPDLIVVEGFPSVWWLWQNGYANVVALMGSICSAEQTKLIVDPVAPDGSVWVFPDGDDAGTRCAESVIMQVSPHRAVRWVKLCEERQPTDCSTDEQAAVLAGTSAGRVAGA